LGLWGLVACHQKEDKEDKTKTSFPLPRFAASAWHPQHTYGGFTHFASMAVETHRDHQWWSLNWFLSLDGQWHSRFGETRTT
jgi:hypothetical protein